MRIATWNVNSVRTRLDQLKAWLELRKYPEIVCLQETKVLDENFPIEEIKKLGYEIIIKGQKTYNGVAVLVRSGMAISNIEIKSEILNKEARVLHVSVGEIEVVNVYVPNGQAPQTEKYVWKFEFLKELIKYLKNLDLKNKRVILVGDMNIAPQGIDVHDPVKYANSIMFTEAERNIFNEILSIGFFDVFREKYPDKKEYTWFDYLTNALVGNRGWRIDFILANELAWNEIDDIKIDHEPRGWERPSDHCPVVVKIKN